MGQRFAVGVVPCRDLKGGGDSVVSQTRKRVTQLREGNHAGYVTCGKPKELPTTHCPNRLNGSLGLVVAFRCGTHLAKDRGRVCRSKLTIVNQHANRLRGASHQIHAIPRVSENVG